MITDGTGTVQNSCRAQEWYEKLLAVNPRNVSALFSLGQIYFFRREYDDAREYFHKAYKINQHAGAYYYQGRLFLKKQWGGHDLSQAVFFLKIAARKHIYEAKRVLRSGKMKTLMRQNNSCRRCLRKKRELDQRTQTFKQ